MSSKAQIVVTIGPATGDKKIIEKIIPNMDVARLNSSWGTYAEHKNYIKNIKEAGEAVGKRIPMILDLSGPRMQEDKGHKGHKFNTKIPEIITEKDLIDLKFGLEQRVDYIAMSFVGSGDDILKLREKMREFGKVIPIIAKIERKVAFDNIDEIIKIADAIMIARGDLGHEIPLEQIPFVEKEIIEKCKRFGKPVIVATEMMLSMVENAEPTRAEMTDIAYAILNGADAVMLSEESAIGKHPLEAVTMMEKEIIEAEKYLKNIVINRL